MIVLKTKEQISIMKEAGKILGDLLDDFILCRIVEGVSTEELDLEIENYILSHQAEPILKGYSVGNMKYLYSSCISLNEEVVHALPSKRKLKKDDIISIDVSLKYMGYCVDAARTYSLGMKDNELIQAAKDSFFAGLKKFKSGNRIGDISHAIQEYVESKGFKVIKDFAGHGIGALLHEDPQVPNFGPPGSGAKIQEGLVLAIEPMISYGSEYTFIAEDGWTAKTEDGSRAAHYENTVAFLNDKLEILTERV